MPSADAGPVLTRVQPLKRQIGDELELNDDLYCNNTVILAGSCDTSLQSVT